MLYVYGSKRWFDIGCQPEGQVRVQEENEQLYRTLITYERELTKEELYKYELVFVSKT